MNRDTRPLSRTMRKPAYYITAEPGVRNTAIDGDAWSAKGSRATAATPARFISSASAARGERSRMRPRVNGPRSLILTMMERPLSRFVTLAYEGSGSERCAAVAVTVSRISPLVVRLPTKLYQAALPNRVVPVVCSRLQHGSGIPPQAFAAGGKLAASPRSWDVLCSGLSAQADVTKHAREIPSNRRIDAASFSLASPHAGKRMAPTQANHIG